MAYKLGNWLKEQGNNVIMYKNKITSQLIHKINPEFIISYNYNHIIKKEILNLIQKGKIINLHISLLPWNKGAHPNVWSFLENTPKGVTIHLIDTGLDTGDILIQKKLKIDENTNTLQSSYNYLHSQIQQLFMENWHKIENLKLKPEPQQGKGSFHLKQDFDKISHLLANEGWNINIVTFKKRYNNWRKYENCQ